LHRGLKIVCTPLHNCYALEYCEGRRACKSMKGAHETSEADLPLRELQPPPM
jgi:hypothetical protein